MPSLHTIATHDDNYLVSKRRERNYCRWVWFMVSEPFVSFVILLFLGKKPPCGALPIGGAKGRAFHFHFEFRMNSYHSMCGLIEINCR